MKTSAIIILLSFLSANLFGQKFYVLSVKGEVYANDKQLKKRDKINKETNLTFSDCEDAIHLISSKGIFYITGTLATPSESNELILELKNEILEAPVFANTSDQTYFHTEYNFDIPCYTTLIGPKSTLNCSENDNFILEYQNGDSLHTQALIAIDSKVNLTKSSFPITKDPNQVYTIKNNNPESNNSINFNITPKNWIQKEDLIAYLDSLIQTHSISKSSELYDSTQLSLYKTEKYIPEDLLIELIKTTFNWTNYYHKYSFNSLIEPTFIKIDQLINNSSNDLEFKLVHVIKDKTYIVPLKTKKDYIKIEKKNFKIEGIPKEEVFHPSSKHGIIVHKNDESLWNNNPIVYLNPTQFIDGKGIKKDAKFIKRKTATTNKDELIQILSTLLEDEYQEYNFPRSSLNYFFE